MLRRRAKRWLLVEGARIDIPTRYTAQWSAALNDFRTLVARPARRLREGLICGSSFRSFCRQLPLPLRCVRRVTGWVHVACFAVVGEDQFIALPVLGFDEPSGLYITACWASTCRRVSRLRHCHSDRRQSGRPSSMSCFVPFAHLCAHCHAKLHRFEPAYRVGKVFGELPLFAQQIKRILIRLALRFTRVVQG